MIAFLCNLFAWGIWLRVCAVVLLPDVLGAFCCCHTPNLIFVNAQWMGRRKELLEGEKGYRETERGRKEWMEEDEAKRWVRIVETCRNKSAEM